MSPLQVDSTSGLPFELALPNSDQLLAIAPNVLARLAKYKQSGNRAESGGLLFARFDLPRVSIEKISTPNFFDRRSRTSFEPCRILGRLAIRRAFRQNLHFVGEWHTHPELDPQPSKKDIASMAETFERSQHQLNCFVLIIVGKREQLSLSVSLHSENGVEYLV